MATANDWAERVEAWRASGQTSEEFSQGRGFSGGGLRHWAYRLGKTRGRPKGVAGLKGAVRLARVLRSPGVELGATRRERSLESSSGSGSAMAVEIRDARVIVPAGFDAATLRNVLAVLDERAAGARR